MLSLQFIRENPDIVRAAIVNKSVKMDFDAFLALDEKRKPLQQEVESLRARRNELSASMGKGKPDPLVLEEAKKLKEELQTLEKEFETVETEHFALLKKIPNIPTDDTPIGHTEEENVVVREWGKIPRFSFTPRDHAEIAAIHGWIDKERAANVAGSRFAYLIGDLVLLQFALIQWVMSTLTNETTLKKIIDDLGLKISSKPFTPILPPYMIRTEPYDAMDRLEPREDRYKIEGEDLWLQGSAEHVLGSMHANEVFSESDMPVRYLGYATSFRGEAGTYGKDMEGIIRMHQFDKMEMESFSTAETSHEEHLLFSGIQEYLMQELQIPYRKLQKCTYDIGKPNAKGSDIEAWLPGQGKYRETHTADYMTDYQARRLQTRVKRENGDLELIHTNDATAFACGRAMIAILENYQNEDGSVRVPEVLQPFLGKKVI
ncbi:serine--tRNA ligase [Candidatus Gracilibacteria bacterium]|nr:serine--tRNA ligase [Candidatus Gracilibacteria bacterium]